MYFEVASNLLSFFGIFVGMSGFCAAFAAAAPTIISKDALVRLIGCQFLASGFLLLVLCVGIAGPVLQFSAAGWLAYRASIIAAMLFSAVTIYRLYRELRG